MVRMLSLRAVEESLQEKVTPELKDELVEDMIAKTQARKRVKAPPPPEGGITMSQAARNFDMPTETIRRWVKNGLVPVIEETKNCIYIDKRVLTTLVKKYKAFPGRGRRTVYKSELQTA